MQLYSRGPCRLVWVIRTPTARVEALDLLICGVRRILQRIIQMMIAGNCPLYGARRLVEVEFQNTIPSIVIYMER